VFVYKLCFRKLRKGFVFWPTSCCILRCETERILSIFLFFFDNLKPLYGLELFSRSAL